MTIRPLPDFLKQGAHHPTRRRHVVALEGTPEATAHARDWARLVDAGLIGAGCGKPARED